MKPNRKNRTDRRNDGKHKRDNVPDAVISDSPIVKCFASYASELDSKHDKYERVVKLSRDITIESKRIIFLLHSADKENRKQAVVQEAELRLIQLEKTLFKSIGEELQGEDPYQFLRAYTSGLQEYVEAFTFYHYLKNKKLEGWDCVKKKLVYCVEDDAKTDSETRDDSEPCIRKNIEVMMSPSDYVLGVADLTGELMRNCINCLGSGQLDSCMEACAFVKEIYNGFLGVGNSGPKEFSRKLFTLKQSLTKMENACYAICVRGSEIPKNMLADVLQDPGTGDNFEEDEGFY